LPSSSTGFAICAAEMRSDLVRALSGQAVQATPLMSDDERTELMRAAPVRVGGNGSPKLDGSS
jgi:serine/threonine-protein kinase